MSARDSMPHIATIPVAAVAACSKTAPPRLPTVPVSVPIVRRAAVPYVVTANGVAEPMQTVAVEAQVNGILTRVNFSEGQDVSAGQGPFQKEAPPHFAGAQQGPPPPPPPGGKAHKPPTAPTRAT